MTEHVQRKYVASQEGESVTGHNSAFVIHLLVKTTEGFDLVTLPEPTS